MEARSRSLHALVLSSCGAALLLVLLSVSAAGPVAPAAGDAPAVPASPPAPADALARDLHEYMSRVEAIGYSGALLVARGDEVVLAEGYGLADRSRGLPFTAATVASVGSITKQLTAAAILVLESQGRLAVEDPIGKYLPGVPPDKAGITLHQLLTHTSGLGELDEDDFDPVTREAVVSEAMAKPLDSPPGSRYAYSNLGYSLLGVILERVTGEPYESFLRRELFLPAGMFETGYLAPRWQEARLARGYRGGAEWGTIASHFDPAYGPYWILRANGGIHSTLFDMLRWVRALEGDRVLPAAERKKLFGHYTEEPGGETWYGYGWSVGTTARGTPVYQHDGSNGIFFADLHWYPVERVVTYAVSNVAELKLSSFPSIDRIVFGEPYRLPPKVERAAAAAADLAAEAGRYALPGGGRLAFTVTDRNLELSIEGQDALDRLLAPAPADAERYRACNAEAAELVAALARGDFARLRAARGEEQPERPYAKAWEQLTAEKGAYQGVEVLGTAPAWFHPPSWAATWVRLRFAKGAVIRRLHWKADGHLLGLGGEVFPAPVTLWCVPSGEAECTAVSLVLDTPPARASFRRGEGGAVAGVRLELPGGVFEGAREVER